MPALVGQSLVYSIRAEHRRAHQLVKECLPLSQATHYSAHEVTAHYMLGQSLLWLGDVGPAQHHFWHGYERYETKQRHALAIAYGEDSGRVCLTFEVAALFVLGYPEQTLVKRHEALHLLRWSRKPTSGGMKQKSIGAKENSCSAQRLPSLVPGQRWQRVRGRMRTVPRQKLKHIFCERLQQPVGNKPTPGNSARRGASLACGSSRASGKKLT